MPFQKWRSIKKHTSKKGKKLVMNTRAKMNESCLQEFSDDKQTGECTIKVHGYQAAKNFVHIQQKERLDLEKGNAFYPPRMDENKTEFKLNRRKQAIPRKVVEYSRHKVKIHVVPRSPEIHAVDPEVATKLEVLLES